MPPGSRTGGATGARRTGAGTRGVRTGAHSAPTRRSSKNIEGGGAGGRRIDLLFLQNRRIMDDGVTQPLGPAGGGDWEKSTRTYLSSDLSF